MRYEDLPPHGELLTGEKCRFSLPEDLRESLAAVLRRGEGGSAIMLVERSLQDFANASDLEGMLEREGFKVQTLLCEPSVIHQVYALSDGKKQKAGSSTEDKSQQRRKFDQLIRDGVASNASDIMIHRHMSKVAVRFHTDGEWGTHHTIPYDGSEEFMRAIYDTIAGDEKETAFDMRLSQDAATTVHMALGAGQPAMMVRVRIHTQPEQGGFCMYLRILPVNDQEVKSKPFEAFGYRPDQASALMRAVRSAQGAILFVGETGSGKTTSLHNCMLVIGEMYEGRKNIVTVEDPPEIYIPGAHQTFADSSKGDDGWEQGMRSGMRSVPNFFMVGEIRDKGPARLLVDATLSGHRTLASLHSGGAFQTVDRLAEMEIRPSTLANPKFLSCLVYQALLPVLCGECKRPYTSSSNFNDQFEAELRERLVKAATATNKNSSLQGLYVRSGVTRDGKPCPACRGRGTVGRTVAAEVVSLGQVNSEYYDYFRDNRVAEAHSLWVARGGFTALHHALEKVFAGTVDPHEVEGKLGPLEMIPKYAAMVAEYNKPHDVISLHERRASASPAAPHLPVRQAVPVRLKLPNGNEVTGEAMVELQAGEYVLSLSKPTAAAAGEARAQS